MLTRDSPSPKPDPRQAETPGLPECHCQGGLDGEPPRIGWWLHTPAYLRRRPCPRAARPAASSSKHPLRCAADRREPPVCESERGRCLRRPTAYFRDLEPRGEAAPHLPGRLLPPSALRA